jgi:hypothetical protein
MQRTESNPVNVSGSEELQNQLEAIAQRVVPQAAKSGTVKSLGVIQKAIVQRTPRGKSKQLQKSIGKRLTKRDPEFVEGKAGVNVGKNTGRGINGGRYGTSAPHGHLVTLGTSERYTNRGAYRGQMAPNDFVNRGFYASQQQAARTLIDRVQESLPTE